MMGMEKEMACYSTEGYAILLQVDVLAIMNAKAYSTHSYWIYETRK